MAFKEKEYKAIKAFILKKSRNPVKIIAISKNQDKSSVLSALESGVRVFGENRVQEAQKKFLDLKVLHRDIELHMTGPLQTNKIKQALKVFDVFQTLDRAKLIDKLTKYPELIKNKKFFIQINTGKEQSKSGIFPEEANKLINYCKEKTVLNIVGLMCIPPVNADPSTHFNLLKDIAEKNNIKNLSMGMSRDYKSGILCGATHVRIGTKLFGSRNEK